MAEEESSLKGTLQERIKQIKVQRRAGRIIINKPVDPDGEEVSSAKVYVDGNYIGHYAPETLIFGPGLECDSGSGIPCDFGTHTIRVDKTIDKVYHSWEQTYDIQQGTDISVTPVLKPGVGPKGNLEWVEFVDWDDVCAFIEFRAINLVPKAHYYIEVRTGAGPITIYSGAEAPEAPKAAAALAATLAGTYAFTPIHSTFSEELCIPWANIGDGDIDVEIRLYYFGPPQELLASRVLYIPTKPPPLHGTVDIDNSVIPDSIFVKEPETFTIRVINQNADDVAVQFHETLEFRGVGDVADKQYSFESDWSETLLKKNQTVDLPIEVELPKSAIPKAELYAMYDVYSVLRGRVPPPEEPIVEWAETIIVSIAVDTTRPAVGDTVLVYLVLRNIGSKEGTTTVSAYITTSPETTFPEKTTPTIPPQSDRDTEFQYSFTIPAGTTPGSYAAVIVIKTNGVVTDRHVFGITIV